MNALAPLEPARPGLADLAAVRGVLGAAFVDDPMFAWLFPEPTSRFHAGSAWLGLFAEAFLAAGTVDLVRIDDRVVGAALWRIDDRPLPFPDAPSIGGLMMAILGPERTAVVGAGLGAFAEHKPEPPFHYLQFLAVHPEAQGRGLGRQLLAVGQARARAAGQGVYLESTNPANLAFYHSCGMESLGEFTLQPDGPTAFRLWHPA